LWGFGSHISKAVAQSPGTFIATGNMLTARSNHTATLLPDGRVLIVGGTGNSTPLSSAELYDPGTGIFIRTGNMIAPRTLHTATLLADGRVLVAGGYDPSWRSVASAELYDPTSGTFSATGNMINARLGHTATLLHNGKVLIAGGVRMDAELYDSESGTFSAVPSSHRLVLPTATLLPDGNVLTAVGTFVESVGRLFRGYVNLRLSFKNSQLFDPAANTFIATGAIPSYNMYWHTATLLKNGKVLIAGGGDGDEGYYSASASLFDPATRTFNEIASMSTVRVS
jgi:galactose oxidase-like protein/Kelch motif protein